MSPKEFIIGGQKQIRLQWTWVEIEKNNAQFEIKPTTPVSTIMVAIIVNNC